MYATQSGQSLIVILPKLFTESCKIKRGDELEFEIDYINQVMTIKKKKVV